MNKVDIFLLNVKFSNLVHVPCTELSLTEYKRGHEIILPALIIAFPAIFNFLSTYR